MNGNKSFVLGESELSNIFKVFLWTVLSAIVVLIISVLGVIDVPVEYAFLIPAANTALYALKEWIADNR